MSKREAFRLACQHALELFMDGIESGSLLSKLEASRAALRAYPRCVASADAVAFVAFRCAK